jgi:2-phospho-L-lactate guanylyltransferase (CobY/MobA/RfbA family)
MHILVPCKGLNTGKSRLSECLSTGERRAFCEDLLMYTLDQSLQIIEA